MKDFIEAPAGEWSTKGVQKKVFYETKKILCFHTKFPLFEMFYGLLDILNKLVNLGRARFYGEHFMPRLAKAGIIALSPDSDFAPDWLELHKLLLEDVIAPFATAAHKSFNLDLHNLPIIPEVPLNLNFQGLESGYRIWPQKFFRIYDCYPQCMIPLKKLSWEVFLL